MKPMRSKTIACVIALGALAAVALPVWQNWRERPPDFAAYPAGEARKAAFFDYLGPLVDEENARWMRERERLLALRAALIAGRPIGKRDRIWLEAQSALFGVDRHESLPDQISALLLHVGRVPRSLALAQAAKESAWGTSRFATDGYNYFGQRCYDKGCGLIPESRGKGAKFEVRRFDSPRESVASYLMNINSHPEYEGFRAYRARQRAAGNPLRGIPAAEHLSQYSERRQAYVDEIQSLIHFNDLQSPIQMLPERRSQTNVEALAR